MSPRTPSRLNWPVAPHILNPFDTNAIEEAVRMREGPLPDAEIVAVGIGNDEYEQELRTALCAGAPTARSMSACAEFVDPWNVAQILQAVVKTESPDFILMGKQAVDDDSNQAGQFLAAMLGWPQATFASKIELLDDQCAGVSRETDGGIEVIVVKLPAVFTADLRLNEPRYASLPAIMKAKRKPIDSVTLEQLGVTLDPRIEVLEMCAVTSDRTCQRVASVDELVAKLKDEAKVI